MRIFSKFRIVILLVVVAIMSQGCATNLRKPTSAPQPPAKKFSSFKSYAMMPVTIAPEFAANGANQKAAIKINENLIAEMKQAFPGLKTDSQEILQEGLVITPVIEEVKFIGGFARFMVGAMAGSSAVLMKVTYKDAATGDIVATPEFYQVSNAMSGSYSIGRSDNLMLLEIARDIAHYSKMNY